MKKLSEKPHLVGITRDLEYTRPGSWVGKLFEYRTPRCGFTPGQQELLLAALEGATDEELGHRLRVTLGTIKKTWLSIYERAATRVPDVFSADFSNTGEESRRGREKKRRMLAYVRDNPEELRPHNPKLLTAPGLSAQRQSKPRMASLQGAKSRH